MTDPLAGLRAVSLAYNLPGPVAAARLAAMGAAVTKVEPPWGDPFAGTAPAWYAEMVASQEVVALDLRAADDRLRLHALLDRADVLLTSNRRGSLERLGLDGGSTGRRWPRLCHVAIVGHDAGAGEPAGHDLTYQAEAGLVRPPAMPATLIADMAGAERAVGAALALLLRRERGGPEGRGGYAEVSLAGAAEAFAGPARHGLTSPDGALGGGDPCYALYRARDGWIALAALEPAFREGLRDALGLEEFTAVALARAFETRTAAEWETLGRERDLPIVGLETGG